MANKRGSVYVAEIKTRYKEKVYTSYLLRRSYRENGKVKQQTLGNLSALPPEAIAILRAALHGQKYVPDHKALEVRRSWHHGHVAAVGAMLRRLELDRLLDPLPSDVRDRLVALIIARVVAPASKLATARSSPDEPHAPRRSAPGSSPPQHLQDDIRLELPLSTASSCGPGLPTDSRLPCPLSAVHYRS